MKVLVTASARFAITSDGNLWTPNASLRYNFWARYLEVFDEVHLVARAKFHSSPPTGWNLVTGPGIKAVPVPYFIGPWEFIKNYANVRKAVNRVALDAEAVILRLPCTIGTEVRGSLPSRRPYMSQKKLSSNDTLAPTFP
jgi:hypothetical protein